jgi:hypothetical protein
MQLRLTVKWIYKYKYSCVVSFMRRLLYPQRNNERYPLDRRLCQPSQLLTTSGEERYFPHQDSNSWLLGRATRSQSPCDYPDPHVKVKIFLNCRIAFKHPD